MTDTQVIQAVDRARVLLEEMTSRLPAKLFVEERDYQTEDDWLYICVQPAGSGIRASDYAEILAKVENELRNEGYSNVLLVPAIRE